MKTIKYNPGLWLWTFVWHCLPFFLHSPSSSWLPYNTIISPWNVSFLVCIYPLWNHICGIFLLVSPLSQCNLFPSQGIGFHFFRTILTVIHSNTCKTRREAGWVLETTMGMDNQAAITATRACSYISGPATYRWNNTSADSSVWDHCWSRPSWQMPTPSTGVWGPT